MSYNYGAPPGAYGQPPNNYGQPGAGRGGMPPPGMMPSQSPGGMPGHFQPPPNMPNFDMNAPVIRLGVQGPPTTNDRRHDSRGGASDSHGGGRSRAGLGSERGERNLDRDRAAIRESMISLQPPTREELARTIFIGGLSEGTPDDEALENMLRTAGKLRRWVRARDADSKKCKFGFAEYEDVDSLEAANETMTDVEVPLRKNGALVTDEDGDLKKVKLHVVVDEQSKNYINEWKGRRKENPDARQFRLEGCKEDLRQSLAALAHVGENGTMMDDDGDTQMEGVNGNGGDAQAEVVTIPVALDDELSDVPVEMRPMVAAEIKAFRERSNRRDIERLKMEEEQEAAERQRASSSRINRLASPGPVAAGTNGIPIGPRGVQGAPSGPKGYRGVQMPSDYVNGVSFVGENGSRDIDMDDSGDESDEALERKRREVIDRAKDERFHQMERRVLGRERARHGAQERERHREDDERRFQDNKKDIAAQRLAEWNDDREAESRRHEYYDDRGSWLRKRQLVREREQYDDDKDRVAEEREKSLEARRNATARGMADNFLAETAAELAQKSSVGNFKIALGAAGGKPRAEGDTIVNEERSAADVEGLLDDEEDAAATGQRRPQLRPLTDLSTAPARNSELTEEEKAEARKAIASTIPTDKDELFARTPQWGYLSKDVLDNQIRPFVERKVVEYLGVQEDDLVNAVMDGIKNHRDAKDMVSELEVALEDEGEALMKKVWRLLVFWSEHEARGMVS